MPHTETTAPRRVPGWTPALGMALSILGLATSVYLPIVHYTEPTRLACPQTTTIDCAKVTTSPESIILGIPVAAFGLPFFAAMAIANLPALWRQHRTAIVGGRLTIAFTGIIFVLYLLYVELFRVGALCLWCTGVHVITFGLFLMTLIGTAKTIAPP
jgi:uncharacterized membrane protein